MAFISVYILPIPLAYNFRLDFILMMLFMVENIN